MTVDGAELLDAAVGPGLYRAEGDTSSGRWRWTAGRQPWYVPLPDANPGGEVLVNGEPAPPGRVVRLINSAGGFLDDRGYGGDIGANTPDDGQFDQVADRFALSGCALVMRRETWSEVGPFAGRFFAYYEDVDWCWRAQLAGRRLVYDPATTVEHRRSASSGGERPAVGAGHGGTQPHVEHGPQWASPAGGQSLARPRPQRPRWRRASRYCPIVAVGVRYPCSDGEALERDPAASVGAMGRRRSGRTRVPVGHPGGSNPGSASPTAPSICPFNLPLYLPLQSAPLSAPSICPFNLAVGGRLNAGEPVVYRARLVPLTAAWPLEAGRLANLMMSRSIRSSTCDH